MVNTSKIVYKVTEFRGGRFLCKPAVYLDDEQQRQIDNHVDFTNIFFFYIDECSVSINTNNIITLSKCYCVFDINHKSDITECINDYTELLSKTAHEKLKDLILEKYKINVSLYKTNVYNIELLKIKDIDRRSVALVNISSTVVNNTKTTYPQFMIYDIETKCIDGDMLISGVNMIVDNGSYFNDTKEYYIEDINGDHKMVNGVLTEKGETVLKDYLDSANNNIDKVSKAIKCTEAERLVVYKVQTYKCGHKDGRAVIQRVGYSEYIDINESLIYVDLDKDNTIEATRFDSMKKLFDRIRLLEDYFYVYTTDNDLIRELDSRFYDREIIVVAE